MRILLSQQIAWLTCTRFTELTATFTAVQSQRASWDIRASEVELGVQDLQATVKTGLAGTLSYNLFHAQRLTLRSYATDIDRRCGRLEDRRDEGGH